MIAKDIYNNTLTDYGVKFRGTVLYDRYGENPDPNF
jgi:hypothetical protein